MKKIAIIFIFLLCLPLCVLAENSDSLYNIPFKWTDESGENFNLESLKGKPVVLTLAYTRCKTACPLTMQRVKQISEKLNQAGKNAEFVIVSLDPENDSPEALAMFKKHYNIGEKNWHLLHGKETDVRKLAILLGYSFQKQQQPKDSNEPLKDEIIHSNKIIALNKEGVISFELDGLGTDIAPFIKSIIEL